MAMLLLDRNAPHSDGASIAVQCLRDWLGGDWGLLFSHPDDFAQYGIEADRWLILLLQAFSEARTRPIALQSASRFRPSESANGWLVRVNGGAARVCLEATRCSPKASDLRAHVLREAIARIDSRFVMIIDEGLRPRRTFTYSLQDRRRSLFDLIATVVSVRNRTMDSPVTATAARTSFARSGAASDQLRVAAHTSIAGPRRVPGDRIAAGPCRPRREVR